MTETLLHEEDKNNTAPRGVDVADGRGSAASQKQAETQTNTPSAPNHAREEAEEAAVRKAEAPQGLQDQNGEEKLKQANSKEESTSKDLAALDLEKLQKESTEYKDAWQRERADFANYRKRMIQEKAQLREGAVTAVLHDLLEPLDNLGRVLASKSENAEVANFVEGVRMIQNQFLGVLEKYNVKPVEPKDSAFDPFAMEAIATEEREELTTEVVLEVYQVGYVQELSTGKHVIRPARVKVGKPVSQKNTKKVDTEKGFEAEDLGESSPSPSSEEGT